MDAEPLERISSIFNIPGRSRAIRVLFSLVSFLLRLCTPRCMHVEKKQGKRKRGDRRVSERQDCINKNDGRGAAPGCSVINCF